MFALFSGNNFRKNFELRLHLCCCQAVPFRDRAITFALLLLPLLIYSTSFAWTLQVTVAAGKPLVKAAVREREVRGQNPHNKGYHGNDGRKLPSLLPNPYIIAKRLQCHYLHVTAILWFSNWHNCTQYYLFSSFLHAVAHIVVQTVEMLCFIWTNGLSHQYLRP